MRPSPGLAPTAGPISIGISEAAGMVCACHRTAVPTAVGLPSIEDTGTTAKKGTTDGNGRAQTDEPDSVMRCSYWLPSPPAARMVSSHHFGEP